LDKFIIEGGQPLRGTIEISGSKNAALPLMAAALLADGETTLRNIPVLHDISTFNNVIRVTGTRVDFDKEHHTLKINPENLYYAKSPYDLVRKMRASFYMLGALLGRTGEATVSLPGGCAWGPRPVDLHIEGMKALGAQIELDKGYVHAKAPGGRLKGGDYHLNPSSVGATVNLLLAAVKAQGRCKITNAAKEPDVVQLCTMLQQMGASISGIGTSELIVDGVDTLQPVDFTNASDRIETGTFMIAAAMHPESELMLTNTMPDDLGAFTGYFERTGAEVSINGTDIKVKAPKIVNPVSVVTEIYPGFPTDLQAQWATLMTQANGESLVTDTIYPDRFSYIPELSRLGANVKVRNNSAIIKGKTPLSGTSVMSTDLRASVSLVMAAMIAKGESEVLRVYHLDRGYETLEAKLNGAGALIKRVED